MINGCWLSCHSLCPGTRCTFAADTIISNPPVFAHVHCAEALGIPLLMSFSKRSDFSLVVIFSNRNHLATPWSVIANPLATQLWTTSTAGLQPLLSRILWSTSPLRMQAIVLVTTSAMLLQISSLGRGKTFIFYFSVWDFFLIIFR